MITFIRIVLFLMLKGTLTGGDGKSGTGITAAAWDCMVALPNMLSIEGDQNSIEQAITICTMYSPTEVNRQPDESGSTPVPFVRATVRFDVIIPDMQKQVSERLSQQLGARIRFNWNNTL